MKKLNSLYTLVYTNYLQGIMQAQIQKWGNSLGLRISKHIANKLNLSQGAFVNIKISDNHLIITPEVSELNQLLDNITNANCHHIVLNDDDIVGNESW